MKSKFNLFLNTILLFALALTSCTSNKSIIATAVAMTVQAQNTQSASVTDTPLALATIPPLANTAASSALAANTPSAGTPAALPTLTPLVTPLAASTSVTKFCTASATYIGETVPDGTIESPGAIFTKTWTIQNSGTCAWDSTWKLVFVSGDLMGGAMVFNFPQPVAPGQNVEVPIVFTAPTTEGTYTGYWKLESPWGCVFGDSAGGACSGTPYSVQIVVSNGTPGSGTSTLYGVTSVTYIFGTTQKQGQTALPGVNAGYCTGGANIFLTTWATISSNGPLTVTYVWWQSDGTHGPPQTVTFTEAGTQTVRSDLWPLRNGTEIGNRWQYIVVTSPVNQTFPNTYAQFDHECI